MKSMFEILIGLPLFRGVTRERMASVVGMAKFHFLKYPAGEKIVSEGEKCDHITFVISGSVSLDIHNPDNRLSVTQTLGAPEVIAPEFLFGPDTRYPGDVSAVEEAGILQLSKQDFIKIINSDNIFLFNYLNMLSVSAQKSIRGVLSLAGGSLEERIAFWIVALTQPGASDITLTCRHRDMSAMFGVQRSTFLNSLSKLSDRGLISCEKDCIKVLDRRGICDIVFNHDGLMN